MLTLTLTLTLSERNALLWRPVNYNLAQMVTSLEKRKRKCNMSLTVEFGNQRTAHTDAVRVQTARAGRAPVEQ